MTAHTRPALTAGDLTSLIDRYLPLLERDGIRDPLNERLTLWCVLNDLYDLLGASEDELHPEVRRCGDWPLPAA